MAPEHKYLIFTAICMGLLTVTYFGHEVVQMYHEYKRAKYFNQFKPMVFEKKREEAKEDS